MGIKYMSYEQVCGINMDVCSARRPAILFGGGLKFALDRVQYEYEDLDLRDSLASKCAYLWHNIASNQYFADGNKRTSLVTARVFLKGNGLAMRASDDEKFLRSVDVARGFYTADDLAAWIAATLK